MLKRVAGASAPLLVVGLLAASCIDQSQRMATCPNPATAGAAVGGATASAAAPVKGCSKGTQPAADGLIDDFEDDDSQLSKVGGRDGYWFGSKDPNGSTLEPSPLKWSEPGAPGSQKSVHITGKTSSANGAWGSQLGANFLASGLYDASKYAGISFKAKIGAGSTSKVRFKVGDVKTHPDGGVCKSCWNHFGKDMTLTTEWQEFKVSFAEMKQEPGWGDRAPAINPAQLVSINWSIGPGMSFDIWIDDVQFFDCT